MLIHERIVHHSEIMHHIFLYHYLATVNPNGFISTNFRFYIYKGTDITKSKRKQKSTIYTLPPSAKMLLSGSKYSMKTSSRGIQLSTVHVQVTRIPSAF